jgi:hypothetical protein
MTNLPRQVQSSTYCGAARGTQGTDGEEARRWTVLCTLVGVGVHWGHL